MKWRAGAGIEVYGIEECADADVHSVWEAMIAAAPDVQVKPARVLPRLRSVHSIILNALDRDAGEGRAIRGELAAELRAAIAEQWYAEQKPPPIGATTILSRRLKESDYDNQ